MRGVSLTQAVLLIGIKQEPGGAWGYQFHCFERVVDIPLNVIFTRDFAALRGDLGL